MLNCTKDRTFGTKYRPYGQSHFYFKSCPFGKERKKMKYCSKCGNELFGEAVICPRCGCPVDSGNHAGRRPDSGNKVKTAFVLNIIAFAIALFTILNFITALRDPGSDDASRNSFILMFTILGLVTLSFILCIANVFAAKKGQAKSIYAWIYLISVILTTVLYALVAPFIFVAAICGYGILIPVPPILQIIAGVKLIQATKE